MLSGNETEFDCRPSVLCSTLQRSTWTSRRITTRVNARS